MLRGHRRFVFHGVLVRTSSPEPSAEFFEAAVENARKIIDAVKPKRKFSYEMMGWALPDSPESYLQFIRPSIGRSSGCIWIRATWSTPDPLLPEHRPAQRVFRPFGPGS